MSFKFDISDVIEYKKLFIKSDNSEYGKRGNLNVIYKSIIFYSSRIGFDSITEKNYKKIYNRIHLIETINGLYPTAKGRRLITLNDVKTLIGLRTNVNNVTAIQFLKQFKNDF